MKIISKFKDYYDGGAMYGTDPTRVYVRKQKLIKEPIIVPYKARWNKSLDLLRCRYNILGFCGKIYLLKDYTNSNEYSPKEYILWEEDAMNFAFNTHYNNPIQDRILVKEKCNHFTKNNRDEEYDFILNSPLLKELFLLHKAPIYYISKKGLLLNPRLNRLYFMRFYNTVQAFQKIEQFISNELVFDKQGTTPTGGNEVLGRSKGFNEYSFRNAKKRPKRF